jgi:hypothetical protein
MSKDLLSERLVTTSRFKPGEDAQTPDPGRGTDDAAGNTGVEDLKRREDHAVQHHAFQEDWQELHRRQMEILTAIDDACDAMAQQQTDLETRIGQLRKRHEQIEELRIDDQHQPSREELRQLRQNLHHAGIELTLLDRDVHRGGGSGIDLTHLTFGELSKIGLGLSWPIILGVLAAAGGLVAGLMYLFKL